MRVSITANSALIVVDMQNDFCEGGALPVPGCTSIIPNINKLIDKFVRAKLPVIASRDWHPENHISFKPKGPWPPHCVQGTPGAEFHPDLQLPKDVVVISKAFLENKEAYSAFDGTELHYYLSKRKVKRLFICGVATDYCVKETAKDALNLGYEVILVKDAVAAVNRESGEKAISELLKDGAILVELSDIVTEEHL